MENLEAITILLVEDDAGDQKLIRTSLMKQRIANDIQVAQSGEEAIDYLAECKAGLAGHSMPGLILLDLNMPGMGGKEFLRQIKADAELDTIPVVVLTTSDSELDVLESYKLHASGYIKKPVNPQEFRNVMCTLEDYWFALCRRVPKTGNLMQCAKTE